MSKYAIIQTGNKQYRVSEGDIIDVELLNEEKQGPFSLGNVLLFSDGKQTMVGSPALEKASVKAEILDEVRGPKVIAYKYKKRKRLRRKVGHRQHYTRVKITELAIGGRHGT